MGIDLFGAQSDAAMPRARTMKGSGFPKGETLVSPFGGASFGTFLSLEKEKYRKK